MMGNLIVNHQIYKYEWLVFYGISTLVGYLMLSLSLSIYIYIYIYTHGAFNKYEMTDQFLWFQVQINSYSRNWNTLLKPDCHSWWISKMQSGCEDTLEEWYAIKFCFKLEKKCHWNVWNASDCFSNTLHQSSISFWVA